MVVLGLILAAAAVAVGVEVVLSNTQATTAEAFNFTITDVSLGGAFVAGALGAVILLFGLSLMSSGLGRSRRLRAERAEAEKRQRAAELKAQEEKRAAEAEAERLREELAEERMNQATLGGVVMPPGAAPVDAMTMAGDPYPAESHPVDDPEHSMADHRGVLGRLRHDRAER